MNSKEARELLEAYKSVYVPAEETALEEEQVEELYKGKHGQSEKEYQDSRSDGGKMVSGDSKMSGSAYTSRATSSTGPNPAGGSKKPMGQGRMTKGARVDLELRKANMMKKEETEDSLRDRRMERGGVDGNTNYRRPAKNVATGPKKKPSGNSMSAFDKVVGDLKAKYGDKAVMAKKTVKKEETEVDEAVYGGTPDKKEAPKDDRMMVTAADKRGNTKAYQNYKAGMKSKLTGKAMYKAGPGVDEGVEVFDKVAEFLCVEGYAETIEEAQWIMVNLLDEELVEEIVSNY